MIQRSKLIAFFLFFSVGIGNIFLLPTCAATESTASDTTSSSTPTSEASNSEVADPEAAAWETEDTLLEQNGTMEFLKLINKERLKKSLPPLAVTENMQIAAQNRAKELETKCSATRPNSKGLWYTIFVETGVVHDIAKLSDKDQLIYNASESRASGQETAEGMYEEWMADTDTKTFLLKSTMTHLGLGHTTGNITINGKEDTDPWVLLLIGKYKPDALTLKDPEDILTVPKGLSIDDMGLALKLRAKSPEGYPCIGELPIVSEMCTGYNSSKTGTQKVTVKYKYSSTVSLTTTFQLNVENSTPKVPDIFNATGTSYNTVTVKWSPVEKATSYKIYRSTKKNSGYKSIKTLKNSDLTLDTENEIYTYKDTGLTSGQMYYYKIKALSGSTASEYSSWDEAKPNVDAPTSVKVKKKSSTKVKVSWKKVKHATSYRVYYATSKNGHYKRAGITTKTSFTISKLSKSQKTYYFKVLSYRKKLPGKYSEIVKKKMR